jgi:hypothetical protein
MRPSWISLPGAASHFAPHRVEAGDGYGFGGIIDDYIDPGGLLEGMNIAPVAPDDAPLHLVGGDFDYGCGYFDDVVGGHALDGIGDQLAGTVFAFFAGFHFDLADDARHVRARLFFHILQQELARLFFGQFGDALQFGQFLFVQLIHVIAALIHEALALIQGLFALFQAIQAVVEFFAALLHAVFSDSIRRACVRASGLCLCITFKAQSALRFRLRAFSALPLTGAPLHLSARAWPFDLILYR